MECTNSVLTIALVLIFVLILSVFRLSKTAREIFIVWILEVVLRKHVDGFIDGPKEKLMNPIREIKSTDPERLKRGELRVLEVGVGSGTNFRFYPPGTKLICVDPNRNFKSYFQENRDKFPTVEIERFVHSAAEDMDDLEENSVDVAVTTHVLCSVQDVKKVINQIRRVLVKGGKYYYVEHVRAPGGPVMWIQFLLQLPCKIFALNGRLTRDVAQAISEAGFSKVEQETKRLSKAMLVVTYHTLGVATK